MIIATIIFFASFTQGATGFGLSLISMPLLVGILGIQTSSPLIALVSFTVGLIMLFRYRAAFNLSAVIRLSATSLLAIPLGVAALSQVDADIITMILGAIIIAYALYGLFGLRLPQLTHHAWAYGFGFVSGLLGGAYNTSGPPIIIYGSCRQWQPAEFKGNLQGFFLLNSGVVLIIHVLSGNFTPLVWRSFGIGLPAVFLGLWAGFSLDKWINPSLFRHVVLILLVFLGGRLLFFA